MKKLKCLCLNNKECRHAPKYVVKKAWADFGTLGGAFFFSKKEALNFQNDITNWREVEIKFKR